MTKQAFLKQLRKHLAHLSPEDIEKQVQYYSEMIDDRIEDGMTEEEAVAGMELPEQPPKSSKRVLPVWAIILLILGSPVWLSLAIAAFSIIFSLYVVLWSVVITLYTVPVTLGACAVAGVGMMLVSAITGPRILCFVWLGVALLCAGLCMVSGYLCTLLVKCAVWLTKQSFKLFFKRKERSV